MHSELTGHCLLRVRVSQRLAISVWVCITLQWVSLSTLYSHRCVWCGWSSSSIAKSGDCTKGCFLDWILDLYLFFASVLILYLQVDGKNCSASVELNSIQWFDRLFSLKWSQYTETVEAGHCRCLYFTFMQFTLICHYFCEAPCEAPAYIQQHRIKFTTDPCFYSELSYLYPGIRQGSERFCLCPAYLHPTPSMDTCFLYSDRLAHWDDCGFLNV